MEEVKIKFDTLILKGKAMVDYWNDIMARIGKSACYLREDNSGLFLSDISKNAIVYCHYLDKSKKSIDYIKLF